MDSPILAGMLTAWTAVQIAIGVFFLIAYASRRREREFLPFGLLCFAFAMVDVGLALGYWVRTPEEWPLAVQIATAGAVASASLNAHFILSYVSERPSRRLLGGLYAWAALCLGYIVTADWFRYDTIQVVHSTRFGIEVSQLTAEPTWVAVSVYAFFAIETAVLLVILLRSYLGGRREAFSMLVGMVIAWATVLNDVLVGTARLDSVFLSPYGFLIFCFGVANTLLVRYQNTAGALEVTANQLREATDDLTGSYAELTAMHDELLRRKQLASVGELAASIAHEVRNPLAVIVNAAASLRKEGLAVKDRQTLFAIIEEEIARLNELVTQLLRYARPVKMVRDTVQLADMLHDIEGFLEDAHTVSLDVGDSPEAQGVWADSALIRMAIDGLIKNACQAMPIGGEVRVSTTAVDIDGVPHTRLAIADDGEGMDETTITRARDPFFTKRPKGTGLGLSIADRIIHAHDGHLAIESRPGQGTTVTVELPCRRRESLSASRRAATRATDAVGRDAGSS